MPLRGKGLPFVTGFTANKLLKGAGAGADPTEIDVPVVDFPMKQKPAATRYVMPGWYIGNVLNKANSAGIIWYIPIFVSETTTYIRICIYVSTAAAGTADLRIFNWNNGLPGSLVLSAGTVDTGSTGAKEIVISQQLTRGYYFLAIRCSAAPTLQGVDHTYAVAPPVPGVYGGSQPAAPNVILYASAAYADPAPAPTAMQGVEYASVYLREN